nr:hypothetical protein [Bacillus licheniformis]
MEAELRRIKEDAERSMPAVERTIKKQSKPGDQPEARVSST